jgi:hypothetical protein
MSKSELQGLQERLNNADRLDRGLLNEATDALRGIFPRVPPHADAPAELAEGVLHLVDICLPGWTISLTGKAVEPDGHWRCYLREASARDNDEVIGIGTAPTVTQAILGALLRIAIYRAKD